MNTFFEEKSSQNVCRFKKNRYLCIAFERDANMVAVVQLVRASDCGTECRGFESHLPPNKERKFNNEFPLFVYIRQLRINVSERPVCQRHRTIKNLQKQDQNPASTENCKPLKQNAPCQTTIKNEA